jgi:hypothetical protein
MRNISEQDQLDIGICDHEIFVIKPHIRETGSGVVPQGSASYKPRYLADPGCLILADRSISSSKLQSKPRAVPLGITTLF